MSGRDSMAYDVVVVGAGPAGLAAAIRLRQLSTASGRDVSVLVLEKGAAIGSHILSGAIVDPGALDRLLPGWRDLGAPLTTQVAKERFAVLGEDWRRDVPPSLLPPLMRQHGCLVGSLGELVQWLAAQAEALGVDIYPGFGAGEIIYKDNGAVAGVVTPDQGFGREGEPGPDFVPGMALAARYVLVAEGARGYLAGQMIRRYGLAAGRDPGKYAIGVKELWQVQPQLHRPGLVQHLAGWPLPRGAMGGGFVYHYGDRLVAIGHVTHADYDEPLLSPFGMLQRLKTHASLRDTFSGATRIGYGARSIAVGGWQSLPQLAFPGGALVGCAGGLLDGARQKGIHHALASGQLAAESCFAALQQGRRHDVLADYDRAVRQGPIGRTLRQVRNFKPLVARFGPWAGGALAMAEQWSRSLAGIALPIGLAHRRRDRDSFAGREGRTAPETLAADGVLTFDRETSLAAAGVAHPRGQPRHLKLRDAARALDNRARFGREPAEVYCPAGVYEVRPRSAGGWFLHISAGNCLHCKLCDIKDPADNIDWFLPPAGGPRYVGM